MCIAMYEMYIYINICYYFLYTTEKSTHYICAVVTLGNSLGPSKFDVIHSNNDLASCPVRLKKSQFFFSDVPSNNKYLNFIDNWNWADTSVTLSAIKEMYSACLI